MTTFSRRDFIKKAGTVLAAGFAMPHRLPAPIQAGLSGEPPAAPRTLPTPYELQTAHFALQMDLKDSDYVTRFYQLSAQGYRPIWVQGCGNGVSGPTISGIWVRDGSMTYAAWVGMDSAGFQAKFDLYKADLVPISVSGYQDAANTTRFAAIWVPRPAGLVYIAIHEANSTAYQNFYDTYKNSLIPLVLDGYPTGVSPSAAVHYISVWVNQPALLWAAMHGGDTTSYQTFSTPTRAAATMSPA
jgi:hypothetical protein